MGMGDVAVMLQAVQTRIFTGLQTPGCFSAPEAVLSVVLMCVCIGGVVLLSNFRFVGEVRLTVLARFKERAMRIFRAIDKAGSHKHAV